MSRSSARGAVVLVNQFYPPDHAPTGIYLAGLAQELASNAPVRVLTGRASYDGDQVFSAREAQGAVRVHRVWTPRLGRLRGLGRLAGYLCFAVGVYWRLACGPRPRAVLALTTPPFLGWVVALAARWRGVPHMHWVMDAWPDALMADRGHLRGWAAWSCARLGHLARRHLGPARLVIALGEGMARRLARYRRQPVMVAPLWATVIRPKADVVAAMRRRMGWTDDEVVFAYCGNLGRGHRWRDFAEAADAGPSTARWVFIGGGLRRRELDAWCAEHPDVRIDRLPYCAEADLPALLAAVDVHLISVERGWEGVVVPSKMQNVLAVGRPALVVAPAAAEPARWVRLSGAGWVVEPGAGQTLSACVAEAVAMAERQHRSDLAQALAERRFGVTVKRDLALAVRAASDPQWCAGELS